MLSSLKPTLANMATMGIVFLPGMMTGQILGGVDPILAIKYQITIMVAIFVTTVLGVLVCVIVVVEKGFDDYDLMVEDIKKV
jgi:putative ABC transport system permease protein